MKKLIYVFTLLIATTGLSFGQSNFAVTVGGAGLSFSPDNLTISAGDSVTWSNAGGFHNVNGTQATYSSNPESFGNGGASSASWTYGYRFNTPGVYDYQCDPHAGAGMVGQIIVQAAPAPVYDIATVSTVDVDGVADSLNVECELRGVVYSENFRPGGLQFYMQDPSGGIYVFNFNGVSNYVVTVGDSIHVTGTIDQFRGLTEIIPDSIEVISSNNSTGLPQIVTEINDQNEGAFVKLEKFYLVDPAQWTNSGAGFNVDVTNGIDTVVVRIDNDAAAYGMAPPSSTDTLNFSGAASQFDNSNPFTTGYQLLPSTVSDVVMLNAECVPIYPIATVHTEDNDGVADSVDVICELRGVVHSIDFDGNNGISFYIADNTGFMNIFNFDDVSNYVVTIGDSIHASGEIAQFRGLTALIPDSIELISQGNAIRAPLVVPSLVEENESFLVTLENLVIVDPADWTNSGSGFNVPFTNGTDTFTVRIQDETDIFGLPAPMTSDTFAITGLVNQRTGSSNPPFEGGYQLLPRFQTDIDTGSFTMPPVGVDTIPVYTIATVQTEDADGVADSLDVDCELRGVVTSIDFDGNDGYSFYIQDPTGGISIFNFSDVSGYVVSQGDSIHATGSIDQFRGLTQLRVDSIALISQGNTVPDPLVVTALDESTESVLVTLEDVFMVDTAQWGTGGSFNFDVTDGVNTYTVRIDSDTDILGIPSPLPGDTLTITGVGGQFDENSPFDEGYQMLPRFLADLQIDSVVTSNAPGLTHIVRVFPNPAQDILIVEAEGIVLERVRLIDMMGREVMRLTTAQSRANLNVASLQTGVYSLVIETREGRATRQVMIKR